MKNILLITLSLLLNFNYLVTFLFSNECAEILNQDSFEDTILKEQKKLINLSLETALRIEIPDLQATQLLSISSRFVELGMNKRGMESTLKALKLVQRIDDDNLKLVVLTHCADNFIRLEEYSRVSNIIKHISQIENKKNNFDSLTQIAINLSAAKRFNEAFKIIDLIGNEYQKCQAVSQIVIDYIDLDSFEKAVQQVNKISCEVYRNISLEKIAIAYAEAGLFDSSLKISTMIKNDFNKSKVLTGIVKVFLENDRFPESIKLTDQINIHLWKSKALLLIAQRKNSIGESDLAKELLSLARTEIILEKSDDLIKDSILQDIATQYAKMHINSDEIFLIHNISRPQRKITTLITLADIYISENEIYKAIEFLDCANQIRKEARYQMDSSIELDLLNELINCYIKAGRNDKAFEIIQTIDNTHQKNLALSFLSKNFAIAQQINSSLDTLNLIKIEEIRNQTLLNIVEIVINQNNIPLATEILLNINSPLWRSDALCILANAYFSIGSPDLASKLLKDAQEQIKQVNDSNFDIPIDFASFHIISVYVNNKHYTQVMPFLSELLLAAESRTDYSSQIEALLYLFDEYSKLIKSLVKPTKKI